MKVTFKLENGFFVRNWNVPKSFSLEARILKQLQGRYLNLK
jgi:hypothetical protein